MRWWVVDAAESRARLGTPLQPVNDKQEFTFFGAQTSSCMSIDHALRARLFIASLTTVWRLLALAASGK